MFSTIFLSLFLLFQTQNVMVSPTATPTPAPAPNVLPSPVTPITVKIGEPKDAPKLNLDESDAVTKHSILIKGKSLNYTVKAGYLPIRNAADGRN